MRNKLRTVRRAAKQAMLAAIAGSAILGLASAAQAGEGHWKHGHGHYAAPGYVVVPPGHVHYYAPTPIYYAATPHVVYAAPVMAYPAPVYYGPAYPSLNLGLNIPLR